MCQKRLHLRRTHFGWVPIVMKQNKALDPIYVGLFSVYAVMFKPDFIPDLIQ
jgi:hypothetical protein